ncbi:uncharacterized protein LOC143223372 [Tachypleus tridentatus]|uniref:uncharacterized protein LOC143223372 n=1 Tax=Tachypleus tridentatus TaxID=6853 RepID=UPI003FD0BC95
METEESENFSVSKNVSLDGIVGAKMVFVTNINENGSTEQQNKGNRRETDYLFKQHIFPDLILSPEKDSDVASNAQKAPSETEKSQNISDMISKSESLHDMTSNPQNVSDATDSDSELNLYEIEMERRRIIDKQVVRKKIIEQWALKDQKDDMDESKTNEDNLGILRNLTSMASLKNPCSSSNNFQESTKKFDKQNKREKNITDQFRKHHDTRCPSKIEDKTDSIDSSSLPLNTTKYWKTVRMAHQNFDSSKVVSTIYSRTEVNNPSLICREKLTDHNEHNKYNTMSKSNGDTSHKEATLFKLNDYYDAPLDTTVNTVSGTLALDSLETEHRRKKSGNTLTRLLDCSQDSLLRSDHLADKLSDEIVEVGEAEDNFPSADVNIDHRNDNDNKTIEPAFYTQTAVQSFEMEENCIEREIRVQKEREDMIVKERQNIFPSAINRLSISDNPSTIVDKILVPQHPIERVSSSTPPMHQKTQNIYNGHDTNMKIAMEIREFKERELELRQLREQAQPLLSNETLPSNGNNGIYTGTSQPECSPKYESSFDDNSCSERQTPLTSSIQPENNVTSAISFNGFYGGQHYDLEFAFANKRKENVKVRPLFDQENEKTGHFCKTLNETPVEREIRLYKEREDALRKERSWLTPVGKARKPHPQSPVSNNIPQLTSLTSSTFSGNTQKMLASSRIQKEIDEQTQREMALRADGHIQTISQERTDSKVTRLGEGDIIIQEKVPSETLEPQQNNYITSLSTQQKEPPCSITPSSHLLSVQSRNMCSDNALWQMPSQIRGVAVDNAPSPVKSTSLKNDFIYQKTPRNIPSPPHSTGSSSNIILPGRIFIQNPTGNRGISMHRFIASRGKEIRALSSSKCPPTSNPTNYKERLAQSLPVRSFSVVEQTKHTNDHFNTLPPVVPSKDIKEEKTPMFNKKFLPSVESKIQEELKHLKDREEEMKLQRAHLLASSQPNLHNLENDDHLEPLDLERSNSNPDLSENGVLESHVQPKPSILSGQRKRSVLIAQWEQKMQEA